jgi:hypothetical protein
VLELSCQLVELVIGVQWGLDVHMASMSSGSFNKDDCRPLKIEIHACPSEAHGGFEPSVAEVLLDEAPDFLHTEDGG